MKVYLFFKEIVEDGVEISNTRVFSSRESAIKAFNEWKEEQNLYAEDDCWVVDDDETSFEAFVDGEFDYNHVIGNVEEKEVED